VSPAGFPLHLQTLPGIGDYCNIFFPDVCPSGSRCMNDVSTPPPDGVCCEPGQTACGGRCIPECRFPKRLDTANCDRCECPPDPGCLPGTRYNYETCVCDCDPTTCVGGIMDPRTCFCTCPPGQILCKGLCTDPLTNQTFCGGCPGATCNPFNQECCNGVCTTRCTDNDCQHCGDKMPPDFRCCPGPPSAPMDCKPTRLGTSANCSNCGDQCTGGKQCISGTCKCPPNRAPCGPGGNICCSQGQTCCNGSCVNTSTNKSHCGGCNRPCNTDEICVNGSCQCPAGKPVVSNGHCCPVNTIWCDSNLLPTMSPGCLNPFPPLQPGDWMTWRLAYPNDPVFTCPNGRRQCHPQLIQLPDPAGGMACCPPGTTRIVGTQCIR
jgi:hypothetical protein